MAFLLLNTEFVGHRDVVELSDREFRAVIADAFERLRDGVFVADAFFSSRVGGRSKHNRRALWEQFEGVCYLCESTVEFDEFQVEHVVPLARGGRDVWANLNVAHRACNARKGTWLLSELDWYTGPR